MQAKLVFLHFRPCPGDGDVPVPQMSAGCAGALPLKPKSLLQLGYSAGVHFIIHYSFTFLLLVCFCRPISQCQNYDRSFVEEFLSAQVISAPNHEILSQLFPSPF